MAENLTQLTPTQQMFRDAMANLSAGVNIVTTDGLGGLAGITVSAVCSVTDTPPTMLVCINRASRSHDIFRDNERVCINVLGPGHEEVAMAFAGRVPAEERFTATESVWDQSYGAPVLRGSAASVLGRIAGTAERGSHTVMFVEADQVIVGEDCDGGLVYFRRRFHPVPASLTA
ncbi:flavin reductase [Streptomyces olivaceus]|uniref:flavin reductase n=1 Tax=Streptomyces olivaceus TaxID=47716 RepID=UPI001CCDE69F|nr:flavin reductase [Streptomyces olivaceus]